MWHLINFFENTLDCLLFIFPEAENEFGKGVMMKKKLQLFDSMPRYPIIILSLNR